MRVFCYHGNLKRPRLADDTMELTKLGIMNLDEKNGAVEAWRLGQKEYSFMLI